MEEFGQVVETAEQAKKELPEEEHQEFDDIIDKWSNVAEYTWEVEPEIDIGDITYVYAGDDGNSSVNEKQQQNGSEYAVFEKDGLLGIIRNDGTVAAEAEYTNIILFSDGRYLMKRDEPKYEPAFDKEWNIYFFNEETEEEEIQAKSEEELRAALSGNTSERILNFEYTDYDGDGVSEAFAVASPQDYDGSGKSSDADIWYIDCEGNCTQVMSGTTGSLYEQKLAAGQQEFIVWHGPDTVSYVFGVRDNQPYEPGISGKYMFFWTVKYDDAIYTGTTSDNRHPEFVFDRETQDKAVQTGDTTPVLTFAVLAAGAFLTAGAAAAARRRKDK